MFERFSSPLIINCKLKEPCTNFKLLSDFEFYLHFYFEEKIFYTLLKQKMLNLFQNLLN